MAENAEDDFGYEEEESEISNEDVDEFNEQKNPNILTQGLNWKRQLILIKNYRSLKFQSDFYAFYNFYETLDNSIFEQNKFHRQSKRNAEYQGELFYTIHLLILK